nr:MAG TPA: hypothetical protein [Caudoviricetes sp.]
MLLCKNMIGEEVSEEVKKQHYGKAGIYFSLPH